MSDDQRLSALGESGILARLAPYWAEQGASTIVGNGDDAAVVSVPGRLVMTTDAMVENADFIVGLSTGEEIGRKLAVQNLADIAAMGAKPRWILLTVMAPPDTPAALIEDITRGLSNVGTRYGAAIVGGDLGGSRDITLSVTALGVLDEETDPVTRGGARPGDAVVLGSPLLGRSSAGLAYILAENDSALPDLAGLEEAAAHARAWHVAPEPRLELGYSLGAAMTSMIDLSDGLVRDAGRVAKASDVVIDLDRSVLAHDVAELDGLADAFDADAWKWVLGSGEEHAMLATTSAEEWEANGSLRSAFRRIGTVREADADADRIGRVRMDGESLAMYGFDHFEADAGSEG